MKAADVMVSDVVTVTPDRSVAEVAEILLRNRISGVPVVDAAGDLVGIVSEGDLIRRAEAGTERRRAWWRSSPPNRCWRTSSSSRMRRRSAM